MINSGLMSSNTPEWSTPQDLFDKLDSEFHFTLDPCATKENAKCVHCKKTVQEIIDEAKFTLISELREEMPKEKHNHSFNTFDGTCECGVNRTKAPEDMGFNICREQITSILNQKEREINGKND